MFENYVFDQQPNTYEPEVYTELLTDEGHLCETEDGEAYDLGANAPDPDDSDAGGDTSR